MTTSVRSWLKRSALAALLALGACGGGGGSPDAGGVAPDQLVLVKVDDIAAGVRVTAPQPPSATRDRFSREATQFEFSARFDSGARAGQTLAGTLILRGDDDDGSTRLDGVLVGVEGAASAPAVGQQLAALRAKFRADLLALRIALRVDIQALSEALRTALAAGAATDGSGAVTAAQKEALQQFKDAFAARITKFHTDVAALDAAFRADRLALGVGANQTVAAARHGADDPSGSVGDDDGNDTGDDADDDGHGSNGSGNAGGGGIGSGGGAGGSGNGGGNPGSDRAIHVAGSIDAAGKVSLSLTLADDSVLQATGQVAADGSLAGTITAAAAGNEGTWKATPVAIAAPEPAPVPVPPAPQVPPVVVPPVEVPPVVPPVAPPVTPPVAVGNLASGKTAYDRQCATCHTANVRANVLNVGRATSAAALDSAIRGVGAMRSLANALSAQDKLDITAFITSTK